MELKQAYERLGLGEGALREEVEKRYELLLRKEKQKQLRGEASEFGEINEAYKLILNYEDQQIVGTITEQRYGKYKRFSTQAEWLDHFFSYYRWHLIGGIALVALSVYGVFAYMENQAEQARLAALPPEDLEASFIGRFYLSQDRDALDHLEAAMVGRMPGWQRVEVDVTTLNMASPDTMDVALQQKVVVQLATERPDVYIMDNDTFQWLARTGALLPLDEQAESRWKELLPEGAVKRGAVYETEPGRAEPVPGEEHVYGIELGASPLAESLPLAKQEIIVGLRLDAQRQEKAFEMIERYLTAMQSNE